MSGKLSGQVWSLDLPRNERDVLLALADHADDFGRGARPSIAYLAWKVGISTREVIRCLKWLRDPSRKIIEMTAEPGFHKPACYHIYPGRAPQKPDFKPKGDSLHPHSFEPEKGDHTSPIENEKGDRKPDKGDNPEPEGDKVTLKGDPSLSPEPLLNLSLEPLAEPLKVVSENPDKEKAIACCLASLKLTNLDGHQAKFDSLWSFCSDVSIYEKVRQVLFDRQQYSTRRIEFKEFDVLVRRAVFERGRGCELRSGSP